MSLYHDITQPEIDKMTATQEHLHTIVSKLIHNAHYYKQLGYNITITLLARFDYAEITISNQHDIWWKRIFMKNTFAKLYITRGNKILTDNTDELQYLDSLHNIDTD